MEYTLDSPPNSGLLPRVKMEIMVGERHLGYLYIELDREAFPLGVENFVNLCRGNTYRVEDVGYRPFTAKRVTQRTYESSKFYERKFGNYIRGGDFDKNNGKGSATIYDDDPIPPPLNEWCYPHDRKGLISLVPFFDIDTESYYYDNNFLITLEEPNPDNGISQLDEDHIVIGCVYSGEELLDDINRNIQPFHGRRYPDYRIGKCEVIKEFRAYTKKRPVVTSITKFAESANRK